MANSTKRPEPLDLERDLETTAEDVEVLRRLREASRSGTSLMRLNELQLPPWLARVEERPTSEGWEPFDLEVDPEIGRKR